MLPPGGAFEYTSFCPLKTAVGSMQGSYQMVTPDGETFDAMIAPFTLAVPNALELITPDGPAGSGPATAVTAVEHDSRRRRPSEACQRFGLAFERIEHRTQLGHYQQVVETLGHVEQFRARRRGVAVVVACT